ncbi:uncharacterized protein BDV14DRAFT_210367 [Aspergillus stella-maris]|uniref:uncharacterized protein n=1 Tax=Aspergillus stella-maris TaxID=1810926 RepID=UPI003CCCF5DA
MSFAYPEGECFFKRSAICSSSYDPDKPEHFYGHLLVEYIWNRPAFHGCDSDYRRDVHFHPRSAYKVVKGDWWNTYYGNWTSIYFLYGTKPYSDKARYRQIEHNLCWFLADRAACIRGIYIPIAHQASEDYPEICTFLQVNVLTHPAVDSEDSLTWVAGESTATIQLDPTLGLAPDGMWTMAINIRQLVNMLSLPRQLRGHNVFSSHIIRIVDRKLTPTKGSPQEARDWTDISWTAIASANYGLAIQWKPPQQTTWFTDFIKNTLTIAVGFIPIVGPLAAVYFPLAWTAIADTGAFEATLRELIPVADLAMKVAEEVKKGTEDQVLYLPKEWSGSVDTFMGLSAAKATEKAQGEEDKQVTLGKPAAQKLKEFESIRNFQYWTVMKPAGAGAPAVTARTAAPTVASTKSVGSSGVGKHSAPLNANIPDVPRPLPVKELKPSAKFELAKVALQQPPKASSATGQADKVYGGLIQEVKPDVEIQKTKEKAAADGTGEDWLAKYLFEELFGAVGDGE